MSSSSSSESDAQAAAIVDSMNNSSSTMGSCSWEFQEEGDSTVQEWLRSGSSDGSSVNSTLHESNTWNFHDDHSGSLVFSKGNMGEPGIAEEWDDAWESLYTMDDDTIYTTLTKGSKTQPVVVFEDMPAPPKKTKKKKAKQKQANIENLSNAMQHLSQCAKAQGMSKEELMELMELLMAQQTDEKGRKALAAAKKVLIRSDDFLTDNTTKEDTLTKEEEEEVEVGEQEQEEAVEEPDITTSQDKLPRPSTTVDVDDFVRTPMVVDDVEEVSLEEQGEDQEEEYYDEVEEIPDEHCSQEEDEEGLSVLEEASAEEEEDESSEDDVNQEIALPALDAEEGRKSTLSESGPRLPWMSWMSKRAPKASTTAASKPQAEAVAKAPPTEPVRSAPQDLPTVAKPGAADSDPNNQKERKRRWFQFWLLHRKPNKVSKELKPQASQQQPQPKPAKKSLQSRFFSSSRSRTTTAASSSARRSKHALPPAAAGLASRPLTNTSEHTACMDESISSTHTFASTHSRCGTVTSSTGVAPDPMGGVRRQLSAIHESPTMAEC